MKRTYPAILCVLAMAALSLLGGCATAPKGLSADYEASLRFTWDPKVVPEMMEFGFDFPYPAEFPGKTMTNKGIEYQAVGAKGGAAYLQYFDIDETDTPLPDMLEPYIQGKYRNGLSLEREKTGTYRSRGGYDYDVVSREYRYDDGSTRFTVVLTAFILRSGNGTNLGVYYSWGFSPDVVKELSSAFLRGAMITLIDHAYIRDTEQYYQFLAGGK